MPYNGGFELQVHRTTFTTGPVVILHKLWVQGYVGYFSAWFDIDGSLVDAEQIFAPMRTRSVRRGSKCWKAVEARGCLFIESKGVTDGPERVSEADR